jgi:hypothetical protein
MSCLLRPIRVTHLVRLGWLQREVTALDSSTSARLRGQVGKAALLGKGYCQRAGRAGRANLIAAAVSGVLIRGVGGGLVRGRRFGASWEAAVSQLFADLPKSAAAALPHLKNLQKKPKPS